MRVWMFVVVLVSLGCLFGEEAEDPYEAAARRQREDIAGLHEEIARLEDRREPFLAKSAMELRATRQGLHWLEYRTQDPTLHHWSAQTQEKVHHTFSIGRAGHVNYRADDDMVVTAQNQGSEVRYHVYDATQIEQTIGEFAMPAPRTEARWWAYDVDGGVVYLVTEGDEHTLWSWSPGDEAPAAMFTLEEQGVNVERFVDLKIWGSTMLFIESGRLWSIDLEVREPVWFRHKEEVREVSFDEHGVLFAQATDGLRYYDLAERKIRRIDAEIEALGWGLNDTFDNIHLWRGGRAIKHKGWVVYETSWGIWAYHLTRGDLQPLLLNTHDEDVRISYTQPVMLEDCTLLIKGLESNNGAVGANGPIWKVDTGL